MVEPAKPTKVAPAKAGGAPAKRKAATRASAGGNGKGTKGAARKGAAAGTTGAATAVGRNKAVAVRPVTPDMVDDMAALFADDPIVDDCWCMWYLMRVADFHSVGQPAKRAGMVEMIEDPDQAPVGLLAYLDGEPVGWCATGPRSRYTRLVKTPTMKGRDPSEDDDVWFMPCFFVKRSARLQGVTHALVEAAVELARAHGAKAVQGFPNSGRTRRSGHNSMGVESQFSSAGFEVESRPTDARVIMRLELD